MIRSALIALIFASLVSAFGIGLFSTAPAEAAPLFRIIDVRAEYGSLVVEVQHYKVDGSHDYYENYTWVGREQYWQPRVVDQLGTSPKTRMFIKSDGRAAPTRVNSEGTTVHYLPDGEQWLRQNRPHLDDDSILSVIQQIHGQRVLGEVLEWSTNWGPHPKPACLSRAMGGQLLHG